MPFLNCIAGPMQGLSIELRGDMILGRDADCDVVLAGPAVSRRHAVISNLAGTLHIEDSASRNGTYLNGQLLTGRTPLQYEDSVRICDHRMIFSDTPTRVARQYTTVGKLAGELAQITILSELLSRIVDGAFAVLPQADAGVLMLREEDRLVVRVTRCLSEHTADLGQAAAQRVVDTGVAILTEEAWETPFDTPRSVMCVPLAVPGHDRPLGVVQLMTQTGFSFTTHDLNMMLTLAGDAAMAIENADMPVIFAQRTTAQRY